MTELCPKQMYFVDKKFFFPTKLKPRPKLFKFWRYTGLKFGFFKKIKASYRKPYSRQKANNKRIF